MPRSFNRAVATFLGCFAIIAVFASSPVAADEKIPPVNPPSAGQTETSSESEQIKEYNQQLLQDQPVGAPVSEYDGGGPRKGPASKIVGDVQQLPASVESLWPSPGVELRFPNREVRVTFNVLVDSRTFTGQVVDENGQVANGIDGAPVLFTRSEETPPSTIEVIGTIGALQPGKYVFQWVVKDSFGKQISFDVPFTQLDPVEAPGGSNHRHEELTLPGEEVFIIVSRVLLAIAFAFGFAFGTTRSWPRFGAAGVIILAGLFYSVAFSIPAYYSELTLAEILARIDGWAALGVLVAGVAASLARSRNELLVIISAAAVAAQATTYTPRLSYGLLHVALLALPLAGLGTLIADATGVWKLPAWKTLAIGATAALTPVLSVVIAAGTITPDRGQADDLRLRLAAAAVIVAMTTLSLLVSQIRTSTLATRIRIGVLVLGAVAAALATGAPALL